MRWKIETLHKILKSGCNAEASISPNGGTNRQPHRGLLHPQLAYLLDDHDESACPGRFAVRSSHQQIKVKRPRLRHEACEVSVPAYESLREKSATAQRTLGALLRGVSTHEYAEVLPEMAETAGVSRSSVSRQAIEGSVEHLRQLRERRWDGADLLVLYMDGQRFGSHHVFSAGGVDRDGSKHVLGIQVGATENAAAVKQLLTNLRDQGLPTDRKYLFVIDGAKALRRHRRSIRDGPAGAALPQSHRGPRPALTRGVEGPLPGKPLRAR